MEANTESPRRLIVGMSGASGAALCIELLQAMRSFPAWETHLVISENAERAIELETDLSLAEVRSLATVCHPLRDVAASISSGTFRTEGMVVAPCSMKTLAGIAHGYSENLLLRAADVVMKERRKLVLAPRETPFSPIHLSNMLALSRLGAVILPPMMSFYNHPRTIAEMTNHIVGKILDCFGLDLATFRRWGGPAA